MDNKRIAGKLVKLAKALVGDDSNQLIVKIDKLLKNGNLVDALDLLKKFHRLVSAESNLSMLDKLGLKELLEYIDEFEGLLKQQSVYGRKVMGILDHFGGADY